MLKSPPELMVAREEGRLVEPEDGGDGTQSGCEDKPQADRKGDIEREREDAFVKGGAGGPTEDVNKDVEVEVPEDKGVARASLPATRTSLMTKAREQK